LEPLETRKLLDALPWTRAASLIGLDALTKVHPELNGAGQSVAVLDTGIDYNHEKLGAGFGPGFKVVGGYDFFDNDADPMDTQGHGTQVAGSIAATDFEARGRRQQGIAPGANLVAVRITDKTTDLVPDARMIEALNWVIDHREEFNIVAVNISFGFGRFAKKISDGAFATPLQALWDAGVVVVASTGNGGVDDSKGIEYPAADRNVIAVGATDGSDVIAEYTERSGAMDIVAPGQDFRSTSLAGREAPVRGTSFSSPLIAGAAAILKQLAPNMTPADVRSVLRASGKDNKDGDDEFGKTTELRFPSLRIDKAVDLASARFLPSSGSGTIGQYGNANDLVLDGDGVLHFAWHDSGTQRLNYASRSAAGNWSSIQVVDQSGDISGQYISLAIDSNGQPGIAYFNGSKGDLKYAHADGGDWTTQTVDSKQSVGLYPSLQFDQDNRPAIAYYQKTRGDLRIARWKDDIWTVRTIDDNEDSGRSVSLALRSDGMFSAAYENSTTGRLKYARQYNNTGWVTDTVDQTTGASFISLKMNEDDAPAISYYDASPANLKYARLQDSIWTTDTIVEDGTVGLYSQLTVNPSGESLVMFYNRTDNVLQFAVGTLGSWDVSTIQDTGGKFIKTRPTNSEQVIYSWYDTDLKQLRLGQL
jgi:hypothetical protein